MRDFVFSLKESPNVKATLRTDIINDKFELFTIMWREGVQNTKFEKIIPWKLGTVLTEKAIKEHVKDFQPILKVEKYGEADGIRQIGVTEYTLTMTPIITGDATTADVIIRTSNKYGDVFDKKITLEKNGEDKTFAIVEGFTYDFYLVDAENSWTVTPASVVCDGNKQIELKITTPTVVADGKITETSTKIEGVDVEYKDGLLKIEIDEDINWDEIVQNPNTELGADADVLYVGIHLERPTEEITHVLISDGTNETIEELGKHAATTATGRFYYFGVAKKVTKGEGEDKTETWETITDEEAKERTVKWYALEEEKEVLKAIEKFNVIRVLKEKEVPVDPTPTEEN